MYKKGFTLIEILLAIAILAAMGTLVYGTFARSYDGKVFVEEMMDKDQQIRVALTRMTRELGSAYIIGGTHQNAQEIRVKTIFKGEPESAFHRLTFSSFNNQVLHKDAKESDQMEITYFVAEDEEHPSQMNIMRRRDSSIDDEPEEGGYVDVLLENIKGFQIEYWSDREEEWKDEWDTESEEFRNRLPRYIKMKIIMSDIDNTEKTFLAQAKIELPEPLAF